MTELKFRNMCIDKVVKYFNDKRDKSDSEELLPEDVYVVWQVKVLQNFKALLSTKMSDGMYYELTYNGDEDELYLDVYKKWTNIAYKKPVIYYGRQVTVIQ